MCCDQREARRHWFRQLFHFQLLTILSSPQPVAYELLTFANEKVIQL